MCLDLGCGTGNLISREIGIFDFVIGLDISREMLGICKRKFPDPKLALVLGDSEHLPFRSEFFDFVSMFSVLHHLPSAVSSLKEIYRILNNSGSAYIDHEPNSHRSHMLILPLELLIFQCQRILRSFFKVKKFLITLDYSKTDIWDFRPQDIFLTLRKIGFSEIKVGHHYLYSQYFYDLPLPFKGLSYLDLLLDQLYVIRRSSHTFTVTMRKTPSTNTRHDN